MKLGNVGLPTRGTRIVAQQGAPCDSQASPHCIAHRARAATLPNPLGDIVPEPHLRFALFKQLCENSMKTYFNLSMK